MTVAYVLAVCDRSHLKVSAYPWIDDPMWVERASLRSALISTHSHNNILCAAVMQMLLSHIVAATMRLLKKGSFTPLNEFHLWEFGYCTRTPE